MPPRFDSFPSSWSSELSTDSPGSSPGKRALTQRMARSSTPPEPSIVSRPPGVPVQRELDPAAAAVQRKQQERDAAAAMGFLGGPAGSIEDSIVQMKTDEHTGLSDDAVAAHAAAGVSGAGQALPHLDTIQRAFGDHDVSSVRAHVGGAAADASSAIGAHAYATGNDVAFAAQPDLFLAAHEAAHVVQQRQGVSLKSAVGEAGDAYEQHADQVAAAVVRGESVADLLGPGGGGGDSAVQRNPIAPVAGAAAAAAAPAAAATADAAAKAAAHEIAANVAGAVQGVGTVTSALAPGSSGVQSFNASGLRSESSTKELEMLALVHLINKAVAIWASQHPGSLPASPVTSETSVKTTVPGGGVLGSEIEHSKSTGDASYGGARAMPSIDDMINSAVAKGVEDEIRETLDSHEKTTSSTFTWSDSGEASADWFGTVGKLKVTATATSVAEKLAFSEQARAIAGVKESGLDGKHIYAKIYRNVALTQGDGWQTGYGDQLLVSVAGGSVTPDERTKDLPIRTEWAWDEAKTYLDVLVEAWFSGGGAVTIAETNRENTVDDNSWY